MFKKLVGILAICVLVLLVADTNVFALTKLAKTKTAPEQKISNEIFFQTVDLVDSTLGVGMHGEIRRFVDKDTGQEIQVSFSEAVISTRAGIACIAIAEACWSLGVDLETAVRIGHWVARGKWRAFSCISDDSDDHWEKVRSTVVADGLINVGTDPELSIFCGSNYIHKSLNSTKLIQMMRIIDFNWDAFDRATCSEEKAYKLNELYGIETQDPSDATDTFVRGSWVNIDFDERYVIELDRSTEQISVLRGTPKRYRWRRSPDKLPHIYSVCDAFSPDFSGEDDSVKAEALRLFVVAAMFRTWSNQSYGSLVDAVNRYASNYD